MVEFRRNHQRGSGLGIRFILWLLVGSFMIGILVFLISSQTDWLLLSDRDTWHEPISERTYLPNCTNGILDHRKDYSICYDPLRQIPSWIGYSKIRENTDPETLLYELDYSDSLISIDLITGLEIHKDQYPKGKNRAVNEIYFTDRVAANKWISLFEYEDSLANNYDLVHVIVVLVFPEILGSIPLPEKVCKIWLGIKDRQVCVDACMIELDRSKRKSVINDVSVDSIEKLTGMDLFSDYLIDSLEIKIEQDSLLNCNKN